MGGISTMEHLDYWSSKYKAEGLIWGREPTAAVRLFADFLAGRQVLNILEVGCGYGRDSAYLAKKGFFVTGVDSSGVAIELASKTWVSNPGVVFFVGRGESLEFPDKTFDALWSSNFLHLFEKKKRDVILREMRRVLVKRGVLGFSVASVNDPKYGEGEQLGDKTFLVGGKLMHFYDEGEVREAMEGFNTMEVIEVREEEKRASGGYHRHINWVAIGEKK